MRKLSIELPDVITIVSRGVSVDLPTKDLSAEMVARFAIHGATQKVADAGSGAAKLVTDETTVEAATASLMGKAVAAILAGEWTQRSAGGGVDERTRVGRIVVRNAVKAKFGSASPEWKKFTGLADAEQIAKLDEWLAANEATFTPAIDAEMARRAEAAAARKGLAGDVEIAI